MSRNKRNFSLFWITLCTLFWFIESGNGLQGVPTWMCLGIKSPFIEFRSEFEILSNNSISLNISQDDSNLKHKKGLQSLGSFINPINSNNNIDKFQGISNTTFSIQSDILNEKDSKRQQEKHLLQLQKQQLQELQQAHNLNKSATNRILMDIIKPITNDINDPPTIQIIADHEHTNDNVMKSPHMNTNSFNTPPNYEYDDPKDRKYIIPLALKTTSNNEREKTPAAVQSHGSSSNIDDLKRHILMLQNFTKNDKNFQSKFVVFPKLQRNATEAPQTTTTMSTPRPTTTTIMTSTFRPTTMQFPVTMYRTKPTINLPRDVPIQSSQILRDVSYPFNRVERVTIVPQVFLQNDQTPESTADEIADAKKKENRKNRKNKNKDRKNRKNKDKKQKLSTSSTTSTTTTTAQTPLMAVPERKAFRRLNQNRRKRIDEQKASTTKSENQTVIVSTTPTDSTTQKTYIINLSDKHFQMGTNNNSATLRKLNRNIRSHSTGAVQGQGRGKEGRGRGRKKNLNKMQRDIIMPMLPTDLQAINKNETVEKVDLNPKHCYSVSGLSRGQQKLCEQYTSIMPAISRGARAAIQECQHQFGKRRWNCSTVNDDTVFGPISSIGSPEMAFIHALAAATTASFIARACRDGQLASCGCSRSARPKQLHEDWTWGGCGDDLEFGYKFSQQFIDIREKERKRGARGLISVPNKAQVKLEQKLLNAESMNETATNDTTTVNESGNQQQLIITEEQSKTDDLIKLQQKISQEILNSNLKEKEMNELQEKINKEILNSKLFNNKKLGGRFKNSASIKARSLMNLHNNEAGRRAMIKNSRITCKCHGVSGSCSLITCWQQLTSIREIGDYLREKYDEATQVKMNKRGRLQVKDSRYKVPTALDLVYLDESPDWCRQNKQLQWPGTHGRKCNKTSSGLDSCSILCCGRGYNTKKIVIRERCNCKFEWCCHVKCSTCTKVIEEYTCK